MKEILARYIPERALEPAFDLIVRCNVHLKIVNERATRNCTFGGFREVWALH